MFQVPFEGRNAQKVCKLKKNSINVNAVARINPIIPRSIRAYVCIWKPKLNRRIATDGLFKWKLDVHKLRWVEDLVIKPNDLIYWADRWPILVFIAPRQEDYNAESQKIEEAAKA